MKKCIITGGSSGVGASVVSQLHENPEWEIWIFDIKPPESERDRVQFVQCDLADQTSIDTAFANVAGPIDQLLNVAGVAQGLPPTTIVAINYLGLRHLSELASQNMVAGGGIVNVSSIAGQHWKMHREKMAPILNSANMSDGLAWCEENQNAIKYDPYTFSKRCVTAFTYKWAQVALQRGIRMNTVCPGLIDTPLFPEFRELMGNEHTDWFIEQVDGLSSADEIAEVITMLATQPCAALNGTLIYADRGYSAGVEDGWIDEQNSPAFIRARERAAAKSKA